MICPIAGAVAFTDSWGDPRGGGRRHQGTDLMNPFGTPNVAVVSGHIARHRSGAGGLAIYLYGDDGHTYYYAHLSEVVGADRRVGAGRGVGHDGQQRERPGWVAPHPLRDPPRRWGSRNPYPSLSGLC